MIIFVEIGPPVAVPGKKIFEGVYPIWTWRPSWSSDLNYLYTHTHWYQFHINFGFDWPSGFREEDLLILW